MKQLKQLMVVTALLTLSTTIADDKDRVDHFKGIEASSVHEARELLKTYNDKLRALQNKETMVVTDLGEIHLMTYTLENQIAYLVADLKKMADSLEELHLTSETGDIAKTAEKLDSYLKHARKHD